MLKVSCCTIYKTASTQDLLIILDMPSKALFVKKAILEECELLDEGFGDSLFDQL